MSEKKNNSLWIHCPLCGNKTRAKVYRDTVLINFPLYCPKCKKEFQVNVVQLKMTLSTTDFLRFGDGTQHHSLDISMYAARRKKSRNRQCPSWTLNQEQAIWVRSMASTRGKLVLPYVTGSLRTQIPSYAVADCPGPPDTAAGTRCNLLPVLPSASGTELRLAP